MRGFMIAERRLGNHASCPGFENGVWEKAKDTRKSKDSMSKMSL